MLFMGDVCLLNTFEFIVKITISMANFIQHMYLILEKLKAN